MSDAGEWLRKLSADSSSDHSDTCRALEASGDLPSFVKWVDVTRDTAPLLIDVNGYVDDIIGDAINKRQLESVWRPIVNAHATLLRRLVHALGPNDPEHRHSLLGLWKWLVRRTQKLGDLGCATDFAIEQLEWSDTADDHYHSSDALYFLKELFLAGSVLHDPEWMDRARRVLSAVRDKPWKDQDKSSALYEAHCFALLSGAGELAADALETSLRMGSSPEDWQKDWFAKDWPCALALWARAGDLARAVTIAREMGRDGKASRLEGRPAYRLEEIDFPRGRSCAFLLGRALGDRAMEVDGLLQEGRSDDARDRAKSVHTVSVCCRPALERILSAAGLVDEAKAIGATATEDKERVEIAIRKAGSITAALKANEPDFLTLCSVLEDKREWSTLIDLLNEGDRDEGDRGPNEQRARALYHLGRKREAAREAELLLQREHKRFFKAWYGSEVGVAMLYEEAGDPASAQRILRAAEDRLRSWGRWQQALGMYFDAGRLQELERVAREEDELECAIIAYEAAGKRDEAAKLQEEIAGRTRASSSGQDRARTCPACGAEIEPN